MTKPIFTTKHYKAIAEWIRMTETEQNQYDNIQFYILIRELKKDNPKFDKNKFMKLVNLN